MPNPNPRISDEAYDDLVRNVMAIHRCDRRAAERLVDPGLQPMPVSPPAGRLVRALARFRSSVRR